MFDDLAAKAGGHILSASGVRFGHILSPSAAPPALLENSIGGLPRVGVLATVKRVTRTEQGTLMLQYEGFKRIKLINIWQFQPYMVVLGGMCGVVGLPPHFPALSPLSCPLFLESFRRKF
ncbi:hypothetical protein VOLCADRAFT_95110 [Volvox carteri f. nagariensis]|uniref:Uncharacterized protein n=1 Tax=Volvox carteri f. nagariensis TaxID=3068 RepID=D8U6M2_VOLCA|nr:uncharacterized protein VOLCADRAFT_95110 [Volvox carteri f. nagariensis]EFJ44670.1 hypothetical protein VOLCADRAFT_95110 [Volvox carteri f. nagariensis]|eukprot:XP_002954246.1 hypothetical protein VOLCADRAFT_95110 [Volvox carteri f. nagariensis]